MKLLFGLLVLAVAALSGRQSAAADAPRRATLQPTEAPTLLPVVDDEDYPPTTLRVLTEEPAVEPRAGQSQLRLLPSGSDGAASHTPPSHARPGNAPPSGPWCFAEDDSIHRGPPPGQSPGGTAGAAPDNARWTAQNDSRRTVRYGKTDAVVQTAHQDERPARRLDAQALLAILEEEPPTVAQAGPGIPRVLPPPHAMLPPDPAYDDLQRPAGGSPFRDETRNVPPQLPPRRLPASMGPRSRPPRRAPEAPAAESSPQALPPYDAQYDPEYYPQYAPPCTTAPCVGPCTAGPCHDVCDNQPRRLLNPGALECRDIVLGGWVDQGISGVGNNPLDRYNGPVTFNDRYAEYQMNQLYLFVQRETCTCGGGWDFGGRIDWLYGTDARFVQAADGFDGNWKQTERFYQIALPQLYLDVAWNDVTLRMGRFYTIMGYEQVPAPCNFFYSHSYAFQYGEPFTYTGMVTSYNLEPGLSVAAGFTRGINQFDDTDGRNQLGVLGAIDWATCDGRRSVQFGISSGEQGPDNITTIYSLVGQLHLTDRLSWILEHNYGQSTGGNPRGIRKAEWYGLSQYVLYQWTETCGLGARIEWFCDEDGTRVRGLGDGNLATGPYPGSFYEITLGVNWHPGPNVLLRPEIRWDWYNGVSPEERRPYDAGQSDRQLLYGFDLVVQF